jgi:hypothetical protein
MVHAQSQKSFLTCALANERLAIYLGKCGDFEVAQPLLEAALEEYIAWGATAKARHMKVVYRSLNFSPGKTESLKF